MHTTEAHLENAMTINEFICVILLDIEKETPSTYAWKNGVRRSAPHSKKSTQTYLQTKPHQNVQIASLL